MYYVVMSSYKENSSYHNKMVRHYVLDSTGASGVAYEPGQISASDSSGASGWPASNWSAGASGSSAGPSGWHAGAGSSGPSAWQQAPQAGMDLPQQAHGVGLAQKQQVPLQSHPEVQSVRLSNHQWIPRRYLVERFH